MDQRAEELVQFASDDSCFTIQLPLADVGEVTLGEVSGQEEVVRFPRSK